MVIVVVKNLGGSSVQPENIGRYTFLHNALIEFDGGIEWWMI